MGLAAILVIGIAATSSWLTSDMFDGHWVVTLALVLSISFYAPMHLARGIASGSGRFAAYGTVMAVDGLVRITACVLLWQFGVTSVGAYALAVAISPLIAAGVVFVRGETKPTMAHRQRIQKSHRILVGCCLAQSWLLL